MIVNFIFSWQQKHRFFCFLFLFLAITLSLFSLNYLLASSFSFNVSSLLLEGFFHFMKVSRICVYFYVVLLLEVDIIMHILFVCLLVLFYDGITISLWCSLIN